VVFVHGLGGNAYATWQHNSRPGAWWPSWVADEGEGLAVWSLDYDASPSAWLGRPMPIADRANNILALLDANKFGELPLILICHSLGGIVAKQMLRSATTLGNTHWKQLSEKIAGIVFLSTPHSGSSLTPYFYSLLNILGLRPSKIITELEANDSYLRDLGTWFRAYVQKYNLPVCTCFEKNETNGVRVVDDSSADPGLACNPPIPVDADHKTIAKPSARDALVHRTVLTFINRVLASSLLPGTCLPPLQQITAPSSPADAPTSLPLDPRYFVLTPHPDRLPLALQEEEPVVHRELEVEIIKDLCKPNYLIPIMGPPSVGKSTVIRKFIHDVVGDPKFRINGKSISLLYVDLATKRPMRAFYRNLYSSRDASPAFIDNIRSMVDDDNDDAFIAARTLQYIAPYMLSSVLHDHILVAVLENYADVARDELAKQELLSILNTEPFRHAVTLIETDQMSVPPSARITLPAVDITAFQPPHAVDLLVSRGITPALASEVIEFFHDEPTYLLPGVLVKAAARHPPILVQFNGAPSANALVEAVFEGASHVVEAVLADLGYPTSSSGGKAGITTLRAMAVLANLPVSLPVIEAAGLVEPPLAELCQIGWLDGKPNFRLKGFARQGLRAWAKIVLEGTGTERADLIDSVRRLISGWTSSGLSDDDFEDALEEARLWLKRWLPGEIELRRVLEPALALVTAGDELSPFLPKEEIELFPQLDEHARQGSLDAAVASLALTGRTRIPVRNSDVSSGRDAFLGRARRATELASTAPVLSASMLTGMDIALYNGARLHRAFREVLACRMMVHENLALQAQRAGNADVLWFKAWVSWLLNTADLNVSLGDSAQAQPLLELAGRHLAALRMSSDVAGSPWYWWLEARLHFLRERLTTAPHERSQLLRVATECAEQCLKLAPFEIRWVQFYLRSVRRLMRDLKEDDSRKAAIDRAAVALEEALGAPREWMIDILRDLPPSCTRKHGAPGIQITSSPARPRRFI
jgi:hypothetical protein